MAFGLVLAGGGRAGGDRLGGRNGGDLPLGGRTGGDRPVGGRAGGDLFVGGVLGGVSLGTTGGVVGGVRGGVDRGLSVGIQLAPMSLLLNNGLHLGEPVTIGATVITTMTNNNCLIVMLKQPDRFIKVK